MPPFEGRECSAARAGQGTCRVWEASVQPVTYSTCGHLERRSAVWATTRERPKLMGDLGFLVCTGGHVLLCKTSFLSSTSLLLPPAHSGFRPNMRGTGDMRAPGEGNDFLNIFYVKNCGCGDALPAVLWVWWFWWVWVLWLGRGSATAAPWRWAWARGVLHPRTTGGRQDASVWALTIGT